MNKPELGVKRDCPECGARFYDLNKQPAHCPKCDHSFIPEALLKPRKPRREDEPVEAPAAEAKPVAEVPLAAAEKEQAPPKSNKKPGLDGEEEEEDEEADDELAGIEDIDIDVDDEDDDTLLEDDEDEDDDVAGIVSGGEKEDV